MTQPADALARLKEGNRRFLSGVLRDDLIVSEARLKELSIEHSPLAIILGCSDARVPAELIFDQSLGDLFMIRVAGNIVAPSQIGSVEFAAERFGTKLVVVLGHTGCGAIRATLEELRRPTEGQSPNLRSIVDRVRPAVEGVLESGQDLDAATIEHRAIRANIKASVEQLCHGSQIVERLIAHEGLKVVGAEYSLETGEVDFFEGV
ncbi:MAG: carbonic anhydrase [Vicinamibacteria bacterium]